MKPCGLLLVGLKTFVYSPSSCYSGALKKSDISQKLIAKGKAEAEYLVCFLNFICSISINSLTLLTG